MKRGEQAGEMVWNNCLAKEFSELLDDHTKVTNELVTGLHRGKYSFKQRGQSNKGDWVSFSNIHPTVCRLICHIDKSVLNMSKFYQKDWERTFT